MRILFIHLDDINNCPPALNAIQVQVDLGNQVTLLAYDTNNLSDNISKKIEVIDFGKNNNSEWVIKRYFNRLRKRLKIRNFLKRNLEKYDLIWITSEIFVREVGKVLFKTKYIIQLMEMVNYVPLFGHSRLLKFNIKKFAQKAWKIVVPEENRAYIIKTKWELEKLPIILPNKPYQSSLTFELTENAKKMVSKVKNEKKKIILYQGGFSVDRRFEEFAEAINLIGDEYVLYLMGKKNEYCNKILEQYPNVKYLGFLNPPEHLIIAQYAHIGILSYIPIKADFYSELNALYCAPNKIYEYALCGLPMLGTNVLGLKYPFEKYNIGICCDELSSKSICECIRKIEDNYKKMKKSCDIFYNSVDLFEIMKEILEI